MRTATASAIAALIVAGIAFPFVRDDGFVGAKHYLLTIRYTSVVYEYNDLTNCNRGRSFIDTLNPDAVPDGMRREVTCEEFWP